jgi:hypothetical protein
VTNLLKLKVMPEIRDRRLKARKIKSVIGVAINYQLDRHASAFAQQGLSMLQGARSQLIGQRTQLINGVRGHLSELLIASSTLAY